MFSGETGVKTPDRLLSVRHRVQSSEIVVKIILKVMMIKKKPQTFLTLFLLGASVGPELHFSLFIHLPCLPSRWHLGSLIFFSLVKSHNQTFFSLNICAHLCLTLSQELFQNYILL